MDASSCIFLLCIFDLKFPNISHTETTPCNLKGQGRVGAMGLVARGTPAECPQCLLLQKAEHPRTREW